MQTESDVVRIPELPAEWMSAEPSASMAKFPKALAVRFRTVSSATFLFKISTVSQDYFFFSF